MPPPRIVVLDGNTLNPGDLSWEELRALGSCEIYDRTSPSEVLPRTQKADVVLTNKVALDGPTLRALPQLRLISVLATGYNIVDVTTARKQKIVVCNVPAYSTDSVAQLTFALLLELTSQAGHHARRVNEGAWSRCPDFSFRVTPLIELAGKTFGIVGYGRIGRRVAGIATGFGMRVIASTRTSMKEPSEAVPHVRRAELLARSDVVSLHCPLTPETQQLINAGALASMKPTAYLINTARGGLVDETALAQALRNGRLAGAGLDVLSEEPPPPQHPLVGAPGCVITPHIGWGTIAARQRLMHETIHNVRTFLNGSPRNVVS